VSHDRYFVDKLATKIIEIGHGDASVYPGDYESFLWSKKARAAQPAAPAAGSRGARREARSVQVEAQTSEQSRDANRASHLAPRTAPRASPIAPRTAAPPAPPASYDQKKKSDAEARRSRKETEARQRRIADLESRIAAAEAGIKDLEALMSAPGFYENHEASKPVIDRHQALMWEVGDLMNKWETLQSQTEV
ncbi:MAG TPA: hypothetical protein VF921_09675, partial [Vicinamibacterales bacterium]